MHAATDVEIRAGVEITRRRDKDKDKATEIERWLNAVAESYNVLPAGAAVFRRWTQLMHGRPDHHLEDGLIAATALVHALTVVTRDVADFKPFCVPLINPFATLKTK